MSSFPWDRATARRTALVVGSAAALMAAACTGDRGSGDGEPVAQEAASSPIVPEDQLVDGGPAPDSIPPIDDPMFVSAKEAATFLVRREPVIALEIDGDARAYPARIMLWHEIVNDAVGGVPVSVTYCPLCNTGVVFRRPVVDGELLDFGTSGKLYHSNLVMYDRQTVSLWPQALGRAIRGPLLGEELEFLPSQIVSFGDWARSSPKGRVLSLETGHERDYGRNPYVGYDGADSPPYALIDDVAPRLPAKERVVGLRDGDVAVAVPYTLLAGRAVGGWAAVPVQVDERPVVVFWHQGTRSALDAANIERSKDVGATGSFSPMVDGRTLTFRPTANGIVDEQTGTSWDLFGRGTDGPLAGRRLDPVVAVESFWFDWAAFFAETVVAGEDA